MEYRRRRSSAKRRSDSPSGFGALRALILLLIFGAAGYLLLGTDIGKRIKEGYASSLISGCAGKAAASPLPALPAGTAAPFFDTQSPENGLTPAPAGETAEVSLPGIDICMIQMGCYENESECASAAKALKSLGAAGYVFNDGGVLRLIAAAFSDESSANSVKDRLLEQGHESTVFTLRRDGAELLVTADPERLLPIRTAFSFARECVDQLDELSIDFDVNSRSEEYAAGVLSEIRANAENASAGIEQAAAGSEMLALAKSYYDDLRTDIDAAASASESRMAFSSALKELRIKAALRYALLLSQIGA